MRRALALELKVTFCLISFFRRSEEGGDMEDFRGNVETRLLAGLSCSCVEANRFPEDDDRTTSEES